MPDIMMCAAKDCPKAGKCYRHEASGTEPAPNRQTYWLRDATSPVGDACDNFWRATTLVKATHDGSMP